jgi:hypothetical protein
MEATASYVALASRDVRTASSYRRVTTPKLGGCYIGQGMYPAHMLNVVDDGHGELPGTDPRLDPA